MGRFVDAVARKYGIADCTAALSNPLLKSWIEYAFGTVVRGEQTLERLSPLTEVRGKSCLDVGCAYGGCLLAYCKAGAIRVTGIDVNPALLDCATALMSEHGVEGFTVEEMSILDEGRVGQLGTFDIITCHDVIEHVGDPSSALQNMHAILNPGGILHLSAPNPRFPFNIFSDTHFRLFGFSLLPREIADRYFTEEFGSIFKNDVDYRPLDFYLAILDSLGLRHGLINERVDPDWLFPELSKEFDECLNRKDGFSARISDAMKKEVEARVVREAKRFFEELERVKSARSVEPGASEHLTTRLVDEFGIETWHIIARKPA